MTTPATLLAQYKTASQAIDKANAHVETLVKARQEVVQKLSTLGSGPYTLDDGKEYTAVNKKGTFFLKLSTKGKPRGPNKPKAEKPVEHTPLSDMPGGFTDGDDDNSDS